jgi:alpha-maltose-1-phosphate synthase
MNCAAWVYAESAPFLRGRPLPACSLRQLNSSQGRGSSTATPTLNAMEKSSTGDVLNAAIMFEPDGYTLSDPKLKGRQAAGNAFLRAAVAGRQGQALWAYTPSRRSAEVFRALVRGFDSAAEARWLPADRLDLLGRLGTLYLPGPGLGGAARLRLRAGPAAYSLCGVTHTTASHAAMGDVTGLLAAPVMPWDALICTSSGVAATVRTLLDREIAFLRWRFGPSLAVRLPQLPVIPLGVHCGDFTSNPSERAAARAALGVAGNETVALFVGRLSFHGKAHPHAMYVGLQSAARRIGRRLVLLQCGWFPNGYTEQAFKDGAACACPEVRMLFTDGRHPDRRRQSWAAADLFVSLSDNIQETFGLTPVEAMAAGLPVVVADWDGYKDTVRDGVDGFRIPTWMPPPDLGEPFARAYEAGTSTYDAYCGLTCQTVSVDMQALAERLGELVGSPELRRRLGEAGRRRAEAVFDWKVVYRQYKTLWVELGRIRQAARSDPEQRALLTAAPRAAASRMDPFRSFAHYPTALIQPHTLVSARPGASASTYVELVRHPLFSYADHVGNPIVNYAGHTGKILPPEPIVGALLSLLAQGERAMRDLADRAGLGLGETILAVSFLAKMGLVHLRRAEA